MKTMFIRAAALLAVSCSAMPLSQKRVHNSAPAGAPSAAGPAPGPMGPAPGPAGPAPGPSPMPMKMFNMPSGLMPGPMPLKIVSAPTPKYLPSVYLEFELDLDYYFLEEQLPKKKKTLNLLMLNSTRDGLYQKVEEKHILDDSKGEALKNAVQEAVEGVLASLGGEVKVTRDARRYAALGRVPNAPAPAEGDENHLVNVQFQPGPTEGSSNNEESLMQAFTQAALDADRTPPKAVLLNKRSKRHVGKHSTYVQIDVVDKPGTGKDGLPSAFEVLSIAHSSGALEEALEVEINQALGKDVEIGKIDVENAVITQWDVTKCATKIKKLVKGFEESYTRQQVPSAIYHACTNFRQKASFSHDMIINGHDKEKCHKATKKLELLWNYGKHEVNYSEFCVNLCEVKYGDGALRCFVDKYLKIGKL